MVQTTTFKVQGRIVAIYQLYGMNADSVWACHIVTELKKNMKLLKLQINQ